MGLFVSFHLLQEEASLTIAGWSAELQVWQSVVGSHSVAVFLWENISTWFSLGPWPVMSHSFDQPTMSGMVSISRSGLKSGK